MLALADSIDEFASDPELIEMFVSKASSLIPRIEIGLAEIQECSTKKQIELLNQIFRDVHTIKGESGFVAMNNIGRLAHSIENILDQLRDSRLDVTHHIVSRLMSSIEVLRDMVGNVASSEQVDLSQILAALEGRPASVVATKVHVPVDLPQVESPLTHPNSSGTTDPALVRKVVRTRTLIVDDDPLVTRIVSQQLAKAGIPCDEVGTAEEGLQLMKRNLYNVVVCDLNLPGMSGAELLPKLKGVSPLVQVVMLTGHANWSTVLESLSAGATDFVLKAQDYGPLVEIVRYALSRADCWIPLMKSRRQP